VAVVILSAFKSINLASLESTQALAELISSYCNKGDVILLRGDLGSGKTTFAQFFIRSLGSNTYVSSPTFNLVNIHKCKDVDVYHYDLYRLKHAEEICELGFDDAWNKGITLVEWPHLIETISPMNKIALDFNYTQNTRTAHVTLYGRFLREIDLVNKLCKITKPIS
jgi:tRNA threonylcarbamoyladenosine biosynthesis protein TsaE